ncbi:hypothetical protein B0J17DRAFT_672591 [Rhizoctonia solani]|nr:hypothetical protein B0J17DRAFT_672591 [Rhizoctonia solani]
MPTSALPQSLAASSTAAKHFLDRVAEELGLVERTSQIRIKFPDGWKEPSDDTGTVGQWYRLQAGCTRFQNVQYRKFKKGVQHECLLLPLRAGSDVTAEWYCLIERMADPRFKDRVHAIGIHGTDAYDYIQVFHRNDNKYTVIERDSNVLVDIGYPRILDLYHILAICCAIGSNPKTQRYTLQQFNCYFFCWVTILSLARYASGWEITYRSCIGEITEEILKSVDGSDSTTQAKLILILSKIRGSDGEGPENQLSLLEALRTELTSEEFVAAMGRSISSMLWEEHGPNLVRTALRGRLHELANDTVNLLVGGLGLSEELPLLYQSRGPRPRSIHRYSLEAAKLFHRDTWKQAPEHFKELKNQTEAEHKSNTVVDSSKPLVRRIGASRWVIFSALPALVIQYGYQGAHLGARADDRLWRHDGRNRALRRFLFVMNTIRHLPHHISYATRIAIPFASIITIKVNQLDTTFLELGREGLATIIAELHQGIQDRYSPYTLQETIVRLREKNPEWDEQMIRQVIIGITEMSPKEIWDVMLWQCLGETIADAILKVIKNHLPNTGFNWVQNTPANQPLISSIKSHQEVQAFMRGRIERLSKRQIESSPIVEYIPVPFVTPAAQSQREMEDEIEKVWKRSVPMLGFDDHPNSSSG